MHLRVARASCFWMINIMFVWCKVMHRSTIWVHLQFAPDMIVVLCLRPKLLLEQMRCQNVQRQQWQHTKKVMVCTAVWPWESHRGLASTSTHTWNTGLWGHCIWSHWHQEFLAPHWWHRRQCSLLQAPWHSYLHNANERKTSNTDYSSNQCGKLRGNCYITSECTA